MNTRPDPASMKRHLSLPRRSGLASPLGMPALARAILFSTLLPVCATAADLGIKRVWPEYRSAEYFERIGTYFGKAESHPGRSVLRSQPDSKEGYYFLVRVTDKLAVTTGSTWKVQVVRPGTDAPSTYALQVPAGTQEPVYELGLTGKDWDNPAEKPVAWRISLESPEGKQLLSSQSTLWK